MLVPLSFCVFAPSSLPASTFLALSSPLPPPASLPPSCLRYATLGQKPISPYFKMEAAYSKQQDMRKSRARQAGALDPQELRVLQRFYDQLCALVEQQRMSDPLSLMVGGFGG